MFPQKTHCFPIKFKKKKKLMGLCWIHGLASLHKICFQIHKGGAHPELTTDKADPRYGLESLSVPHHTPVEQH